MQYATRAKNDEQILIRVAAETRQKVELSAIADDISVTEWVRRAIDAYLTIREEERAGNNGSEKYKKDILRSLDDEEFRKEFLRRLNGE